MSNPNQCLYFPGSNSDYLYYPQTYVALGSNVTLAADFVITFSVYATRLDAGNPAGAGLLFFGGTTESRIYYDPTDGLVISNGSGTEINDGDTIEPNRAYKYVVSRTSGTVTVTRNGTQTLSAALSGTITLDSIGGGVLDTAFPLSMAGTIYDISISIAGTPSHGYTAIGATNDGFIDTVGSNNGRVVRDYYGTALGGDMSSVGTFGAETNISIEDAVRIGNFVVVGGRKIRVYDLEDNIVSQYDLFGAISRRVVALHYDGNFLFAADDQGVSSYSISASGVITYISRVAQSAYSGASAPQDVWADGNGLVFLAAGGDGVRSFSYSPSGVLAYLAGADAGGSYSGVYGDGGYLYVATSSATKALISYSYTAAGVFTEVDSDGNSFGKVWSDATHIYATDDTSIQIYTRDAGGNLTNEGSVFVNRSVNGAIFGDGNLIFAAGLGGIVSCARIGDTLVKIDEYDVSTRYYGLGFESGLLYGCKSGSAAVEKIAYTLPRTTRSSATTLSEALGAVVRLGQRPQTKKRFADGDFTRTAPQLGPDVMHYPFLEIGDRSNYLVERSYQYDLDEYEPEEIGAAAPEPSIYGETVYLMHETVLDPGYTRQGMAAFSRRYAPQWSSLVEYGSVNFSRPDLRDVTYDGVTPTSSDGGVSNLVDVSQSSIDSSTQAFTAGSWTFTPANIVKDATVQAAAPSKEITITPARIVRYARDEAGPSDLYSTGTFTLNGSTISAKGAEGFDQIRRVSGVREVILRHWYGGATWEVVFEQTYTTREAAISSNPVTVVDSGLPSGLTVETAARPYPVTDSQSVIVSYIYRKSVRLSPETHYFTIRNHGYSAGDDIQFLQGDRAPSVSVPVVSVPSADRITVEAALSDDFYKRVTHSYIENSAKKSARFSYSTTEEAILNRLKAVDERFSAVTKTATGIELTIDTLAQVRFDPGELPETRYDSDEYSYPQLSTGGGFALVPNQNLGR